MDCLGIHTLPAFRIPNSGFSTYMFVYIIRKYDKVPHRSSLNPKP